MLVLELGLAHYTIAYTIIGVLEIPTLRSQNRLLASTLTACYHVMDVFQKKLISFKVALRMFG